MGDFHVVLIDDGILHGCVNLGVPEDFLHLLDGHTLVDCPCCHGSTEFMGVYLCQSQLSAQLAQADFHTADLETIMRGVQCYK